MAESPGNLEELATRLKDLSEKLAEEQSSQLATPRARRIRKTIGDAYENLRKVMADLDPIKEPGFVFDPSNPNVVGRVVGITLIAQKRKPLAQVEKFYGSGVYAIYYNGTFAPYGGISGQEHPIYVGKADPVSAASKTPFEQGDKLSSRLNEHRKNIIKAAASLDIADFEYRALVVQTGWQDAAERYLIDLFKPIWNSEVGICFGFGKHGDAPETRANLRSPWDTLHHGREWAHRDPGMKDSRAATRIIAEIESHLATNPPVKSIDEVLRRFLAEMRMS